MAARLEVGKFYKKTGGVEQIAVLAQVTTMVLGDVVVVESNKSSDIRSIEAAPYAAKEWEEIDKATWERNFFGDLLVYDTEETTVTDRPHQIAQREKEEGGDTNEG